MSSECHETGSVTRTLPDKRVEILIQRGEACGSCASRGACKALGGQTHDFSLTLDNPVGARAGDTVQITMTDGAVVKASAVLYLVPALLLLTGAVVGNRIAPFIGIAEDPAAIVGALAGLAIGFGTTFALGRILGRNQSLVPIVTKILTRAP